MSPLAPPFRIIDQGLRDGTVIPFLGAGSSLGARAAAAAGDDEELDALPSGSMLSTRLAATANFPKGAKPDLATVAQYLEVVSSRDDLNRELRQVFARNYEPSRLHHYLASIERPLLIVTTNYDDLIEKAFKRRPYDLVIHTTDKSTSERLLWWPSGAAEPQPVLAKKLYIDLDKRPVIYKMHGAVDQLLAARDQYVITEDDYVEFLSRLLKKKAVPAIFAEPFQKRRFLFLGYGLRDWNLRVVLSRIDQAVRGSRVPRSWAIDAKPTTLETRLWQHRGVDFYKLTIEEFLDGIGAP
jgi:SIR2-like domain